MKRILGSLGLEEILVEIPAKVLKNSTVRANETIEEYLLVIIPKLEDDLELYEGSRKDGTSVCDENKVQ